jgi:hypothetical protein
LHVLNVRPIESFVYLWPLAICVCNAPSFFFRITCPTTRLVCLLVGQVAGMASSLGLGHSHTQLACRGEPKTAREPVGRSLLTPAWGDPLGGEEKEQTLNWTRLDDIQTFSLTGGSSSLVRPRRRQSALLQPAPVMYILKKWPWMIARRALRFVNISMWCLTWSTSIEWFVIFYEAVQ